MSDQQGNEAPVSGVTGMEEVKQIVLPGAQLAAQRQAKGWSVEHAASQLKFATRQVIALEEDNYAALPGAVIVRGFVRAYAKLLGLDANALVASLPQEGAAPATPITPQKTLSTPFSESPLPLGNRNKIPMALIAGGLLAVALAGSAVAIRYTDLLNDEPHVAWLKQARLSSEEPATQAQADTTELPPEVQDGSDKSKSDKVEVADAGASRDVATKTADATESASQAQATAPVVVAASASAPTTAAAVAPAAVAVPVATAPSAAVAPSVKSVTQPAPPAPVVPAVASAARDTSAQAGLSVSSSKDLLRLTFREDSWVEIRRGDKSVMISRLLKAGTTESFDINEPVTLVIGNAGGVDASLRGSKLDLQTGASSNVARLSLK